MEKSSRLPILPVPHVCHCEDCKEETQKSSSILSAPQVGHCKDCKEETQKSSSILSAPQVGHRFRMTDVRVRLHQHRYRVRGDLMGISLFLDQVRLAIFLSGDAGYS